MATLLPSSLLPSSTASPVPTSFSAYTTTTLSSSNAFFSTIPTIFPPPPASSTSYIPALAPPPGTTPHPHNPPSLAHVAHATTGVCAPLVTLFWALRTYVRIFERKKWLLEDYVVTVAWISTLVFLGIMETTMSKGGGKHAWDITYPEFRQAAIWFNAAAIEYGLAICITKVAILLLYRRVFRRDRRGDFLDYATLILITLCVAFYGATSIAKIFECMPAQRNGGDDGSGGGGGQTTQATGHCIDLPSILMTSGSFNLISDVVILLLPVQAVWRLDAQRQKKVLIVLIFSFALCAPIFATIGFVVRIRNSKNPDKSWRQPEILLWGAAELTSGNLCVCFPELGLLFTRLRTHLHREDQNQDKPAAAVLPFSMRDSGLGTAVVGGRRSVDGGTTPPGADGDQDMGEEIEMQQGEALRGQRRQSPPVAVQRPKRARVRSWLDSGLGA